MREETVRQYRNTDEGNRRNVRNKSSNIDTFEVTVNCKISAPELEIYSLRTLSRDE